MDRTKYPHLSVEENGRWITYEEFLKRRVRFGMGSREREVSLRLFLRITTGWRRYESERNIWVGVLCSRTLTVDEERQLKMLQEMKRLRREYIRHYVQPNPTLSPRHHIFVQFGGKEITLEELDSIRVCFNGTEISYAELRLITSRRMWSINRIHELFVAEVARGELKERERSELLRLLELCTLWEKYKRSTQFEEN